jgi:hypothetical protein
MDSTELGQPGELPEHDRRKTPRIRSQDPALTIRYVAGEIDQPPSAMFRVPDRAESNI